jgi:DNA (cytosine-5)-methyltransferase 1
MKKITKVRIKKVIKKMEEIRVIELFAGVGGFRIGLEKASNKYKIVWSNQWEPAKKRQIASDIYVKRFGEENHSNVDIAEVPVLEIPRHNLLVGGFPCQDYSVAKSLSQSKGITGKKGVLWWEIHRIIKESAHKPEFIFLENVDRLIKSPATQRGRDFAIMLASLSDLGYIIEWRVINAADYGMPQRRRRIFILGYHKDSPIYKKILSSNPERWVMNEGVLTKAFKVNQFKNNNFDMFTIEDDLPDISKDFNKKKEFSPFENAGIMVDRKVFTINVSPNYAGKKTLLRDIILPDDEVPEEFFINNSSLKDWQYLKGAKKEERFNGKQNFSYNYTEGSMVFPDPLDSPSRTIVTGEGGSSPSRFKHVIKTESGRLRRLTPLELERLNMFPDNHTKEGTDIERAFLMGNALVVGAIEKVGKSLISQIDC